MSSDHFEDYLGSLSQEEIEQLNEALKAKKERSEKGEKPPEATVKEDFTVNREVKGRKGRRPVRAKKNLWEDTGELSDVETPEFSKTPRSRQKPNKVSVECHVCGKTFKISKSLIYGEFVRCNRCTGR
tara:strand:- start:11552 stop:11935 length:384 start_codon:yes stop_codon:yes gene_type:complete